MLLECKIVQSQIVGCMNLCLNFIYFILVVVVMVWDLLNDSPFPERESLQACGSSGGETRIAKGMLHSLTLSVVVFEVAEWIKQLSIKVHTRQAI